VDDYVSTLCADIAARAPAAARAPLETVYFGGGTPSLLPPSLLARILDALHRTFGVAADADVSMEMDPGVAAAAGAAAANVLTRSLRAQARLTLRPWARTCRWA
jgi:oxygen-independent coproporphyrinogen-3 oxidase